MSRSGRAAHERKKAKNWQTSPLPPRCVHCRRSWNTVVIGGDVHCEEHAKSCDGTCNRDDVLELVRCRDCGDEFENDDELMEHVITMHDSEYDDNE